MLRLRVLSAGVLASVVIVVFLAGQPWLSLGVAGLALIGGREASRLVAAAGLPVERIVGLGVPPLAVLGLGLAHHQVGSAFGAVALVVLLAAVLAFRRPVARDGFLAWVGTSFAPLYVALLAFVPGILAVAPVVPAGAPLGGGLLDAGRTWLLILVLTVWSYDTAAFVTGRTLGRRPFLSHISPQKTWAGVVGGLVAAMAVAGALAWGAGQQLVVGLLLGSLIAAAAQAGDVAESLLKRAAGAKDSGALIPGHGGILDRIDSFLFAAPAMYVALTWLPPPGVGAVP